ncbi:MAG: hypothetical protein NUV63_06305 [Gallionella sp.]|nr:hypothetical protein [Gallionella sp.]
MNTTMTEGEQKELYRLNIGKWDLDKAVSLLEVAVKHTSTTVEYEALVTSAIIHYARPFSFNEKEKDAKATSRVPARVIDKFTTDERSLHERILDRRNKAIAHAEWNEFPVGIDLETRVLSSKRYSVYPEFLDAHPFLALAKKLLQRLHNEVADHVLRLP